jgi:hypothetical protein
MLSNENPSNKAAEDQDLSFDMNEMSTTATDVKPEDTGSEREKLDQLGKKEFKPLTEEDLQPKLQDPERIKEMNRRTAIDD